MIAREYRLPLCPMSDKNAALLGDILAGHGLIAKRREERPGLR